MKKKRIREGSVAWYWLNHWKKGLVLLIVGLLAIGTVVAFGGEKPAEQQNVQATEESRSEAKSERLQPIWNVDLDAEIQHFVKNTAEFYGLDPEFVLAVIGVESNFDVDAVGDSGEAIGLMQIQPQWHEERMARLGVEDLSHPYHNIMVGCDYLAELSQESDDLNWILTAYNAGRETATNWQLLGVQSEYAEKVLVLKDLYEGENKWQ